MQGGCRFWGALGLLSTLFCLLSTNVVVAQLPGGAKRNQRGPTTTAKGEFSWFVGQAQEQRVFPPDSNGAGECKKMRTFQKEINSTAYLFTISHGS